MLVVNAFLPSADSKVKMWDVRRASSSLLTLDQYNGDQTKAASETGTDSSHIFFLFSVFLLLVCLARGLYI